MNKEKVFTLKVAFDFDFASDCFFENIFITEIFKKNFYEKFSKCFIIACNIFEFCISVCDVF